MYEALIIISTILVCIGVSYVFYKFRPSADKGLERIENDMQRIADKQRNENETIESIKRRSEEIRVRSEILTERESADNERIARMQEIINRVENINSEEPN